jgi:hypothetical protein
MLAVLCVVLALVALAASYRRVGSSRQGGSAARDPLTHVFTPDELRELDAQLDAIAREELVRLDDTKLRCIAGEVGHVVVVSDSSNGVAFALCDGRRTTLGGVSRVTRRRRLHQAGPDRLTTARVESAALSCRLVLAEIEFSARRVALFP